MKKLFVSVLAILMSVAGFAQLQPHAWSAMCTSSSGTLPPLVKADASGNTYTTGSFWGTMDADPGPGVYTLYNAGQYDGFIIKLDAQGNFAWAYAFGAGFNDYVYAININSSGQIILSGAFEGTMNCPGTAGPVITSTDGMGYAIWLDANGAFVRSRQIGDDAYFGLVYLQSAGLDAADRLYLAGSFNRGADFDPGAGVHRDTAGNANKYNMFVVCLDANGDFVWQHSYGHLLNNDELLDRIAVDAAGNIIVAGSFEFQAQIGASVFTAAGGRDMLLMRLDNAGTHQWVKHIGSTGQDIAFELHLTSTGNAVFAGYAFAPVDIDPGAGQFNVGILRYYLGNLDAAGNFQWGIDHPHSAAITAITSDAQSIYLGGVFSGSVDFDPGAGISIHNSMRNEAYLLNVGFNRSYNWFAQFADTAVVESISLNGSGDLFCAGTGSGLGDFDPGAGTFLFMPADSGLANVFVSRFGQLSSVNEQEENTLTVFPNPSAGTLTIQNNRASAIDYVLITDALGNVVKRISYPGNSIHAEELSAGVYTLTIHTTDDQYAQQQLVIIAE